LFSYRFLWLRLREIISAQDENVVFVVVAIAVVVVVVIVNVVVVIVIDPYGL
jgi:hypothetical protein